MDNCGKGRSCATCAHNTPIGAPIPAECRGCIVRGECTKWEALALPAGRDCKQGAA